VDNEENEYRVTGGLPDGYAVARLTKDKGLMPVIRGLQRWQALAIVSVLHPPFED
jgi:hypothetical protein